MFKNFSSRAKFLITLNTSWSDIIRKRKQSFRDIEDEDGDDCL